MEGERSCICAEGDFFRRAAEKVAEGLPSVLEHHVGFGAGGVVPVSISVMVAQVVGNGIDDGLRHLRSAGAVEIRDGKAVVDAAKRWELSANRFEVCIVWRLRRMVRTGLCLGAHRRAAVSVKRN